MSLRRNESSSPFLPCLSFDRFSTICSPCAATLPDGFPFIFTRALAGLRVVLLEIHTCCIHYRSSTRMIRSITSAVGPSSCLRLEGASICVYHVCRRESCGPSPLMALDQYCHFRGFFQGQATSSPHPDCSRVFPPDRTRSLRLCPLRLVKERESPDCGSFRPAFPYASLRVFYVSSCPWCNG